MKRGKNMIRLAALLLLSAAPLRAGGLAKAYIPTATPAQMSAMSAVFTAMNGSAPDDMRPFVLLAARITPTYQRLLAESLKENDTAAVSRIVVVLFEQARADAQLTLAKLQNAAARGISDEDLLASSDFGAEFRAVVGGHLDDESQWRAAQLLVKIDRNIDRLKEQRSAKIIASALETARQLTGETPAGNSEIFPASLESMYVAKLSAALASGDDSVFQAAVEDVYKALEAQLLPFVGFTGIELHVEALHATIEKLMKDAGRPGAARTVVRYKGSARELLVWPVERDLNAEGRNAVLNAIAARRSSVVALKRAGAAAETVLGRHNDRLVTGLMKGDDEAFRRALAEAYRALGAELGLGAQLGWAHAEAAGEQVASFHAGVVKMMQAFGRPKAAVVKIHKGSGRELVTWEVERDENDFERDLLLAAVAGQSPVARIPQRSFDAIKAEGAGSRAMPWHLLRIESFYDKVIASAMKGSLEDRKAAVRLLESGFDGRIQPIQEVLSFVWGNSASATLVFRVAEVLDKLMVVGFTLGALGFLLTIVPTVIGAIPAAWLVAALAWLAAGGLFLILSKRVYALNSRVMGAAWGDAWYQLRNSAGPR